jgi:putative oxidoreductase
VGPSEFPGTGILNALARFSSTFAIKIFCPFFNVQGTKEFVMNKQYAFVATFGRLLIAAIFLMSGLGKVANPEMTQGYIASAGLPFPLLAYLIAVAIELGGGALLIVGFRARIVGVVMAIFTVAAALGFHHNLADQDQMVHFLKNIAITGGLLQVAAFGAGRFSIDGLLASSRRVAPMNPVPTSA